jgi:CP family cyanate transporter-like MFS transporter
MGLGNALSAIAIRERFAHRPGTATGVFATGIQIGSASSAAAAVPLANALGGWRAALAVFSVVACLLAVAWIVLSRDWPERGDAWAAPSRLPLRNPTAWLLVTIFSLMGSAYYGLSAWVPDAYIERGWSDVDVGWLIAAMNLTAVPASLVVPTLVFAVAAAGLVVAPEHALAWSLLAGVAQGSMFALVMTLPLDLEVRPERVAALIAMMLGFGYTIAAIAPFALGAVRDATGSFTGALWAVVGLLVALAVAVAALPRPARASR